jgi:kynurenine formamidase
MRIVDLTQTIEDKLPAFPGDPEVHLSRIKQLEADGYNNHRLDRGCTLARI